MEKCVICNNMTPGGVCVCKFDERSVDLRGLIQPTDVDRAHFDEALREFAAVIYRTGYEAGRELGYDVGHYDGWGDGYEAKEGENA